MKSKQRDGADQPAEARDSIYDPRSSRFFINLNTMESPWTPSSWKSKPAAQVSSARLFGGPTDPLTIRRKPVSYPDLHNLSRSGQLALILISGLTTRNAGCCLRSENCHLWLLLQRWVISVCFNHFAISHDRTTDRAPTIPTRRR